LVPRLVGFFMIQSADTLGKANIWCISIAKRLHNVLSLIF
jgi:hypothetical protein